ncbi:AMP-binding protein [Amycolatopsis sp. NPDC051061]|uniref:AMP-binding protein n=1 Tax=Amycolatopsis sp. NPDC051061 TaxID=3155042 RepID=UPI00341A644E
MTGFDGPWPDVLRATLEGAPRALVLTRPATGESWTADAVLCLADAIAAAIARHGSPSCVWVCDDVGVTTLATLLALRGTAVMVDGRTPDAAADRLAKTASPDLVVVSDALERLAAWATGRATPVLVAGHEVRLSHAPHTWAGSSAGALQLGVVTSGTASAPHLVTLPAEQVEAALAGVWRHADLRPDDAVLTVSPLHHTLGLITGLLAPVIRGARVARASAARLPAARGLRCTWSAMSPAALGLLLARGVFGPKWTPRVLRTSSAPLTAELVGHLRDMGESLLLNAYVLSEAPGEVSSRRFSPSCPGDVGPGTVCEIAIADDAGRLVPDGHDGEIWIRGANVVRDALLSRAGPELSSSACELVRAGWSPTADQGALQSGELVVKGRIGDLINCGGEKIAPHDVEAVLARHPGVRECVAFPVPHRTLGEGLAVAVVAGGPDVTPKILRSTILDHLRPSHNPLNIVVVAAIPKTARGKVSRRSLAREFGLTED